MSPEERPPAGDDGREPAPRIASDELAEVASLAARLRLGPLERDETVDPGVIAALVAQGDLDADHVRQAHGIVRRRRRLRRGAVALAAGLAIAAASSPWWAPLAFAPPPAPPAAPAPPPAPPVDPDVAAAQAETFAQRASRLSGDQRHGEAVALARRAVSLAPGETRHAYVLADCLDAAKREHEAQAVYRAIVRADAPHAARARLALARLLAKEDRAGREEAAALYRQHLAAEPPTAQVWGLLAAVEADLGRHDKALAAYRAAVALEPAAPAPQAALADYLADRGRYDEARVRYKALIARAPEDRAYRWRLVAVLEKANRPGEALAEALAAAARPTEGAGEAPYQLSALCDRLGRRDALIGHYEARLKRAPQEAATHEALVGELMRQERLAEADRAIARWLAALEVPSGPVLRRQGELRARLGRDAEAVKAYEAAIAAEPRAYAGYQALARHHLARARGDAAMQVARLAVERTDATRSEARLGLAEVAEALGRNEAAIAAYRAAAASDAENGEPWRKMAILLARLGRREEAIAAYQEAARRTQGYWREQMEKAAEALRAPR